MDSQTIEVLASWMLEHPLTEEQQAAESPRPEGAPETPSPDGPETVQCPERPISQPNERSGISRTYRHFRNWYCIIVIYATSLVMDCMLFCYFQPVARVGLDREGELLGCPPDQEQTSSSTAATLRPNSEDLLPKSRSEFDSEMKCEHQS